MSHINWTKTYDLHHVNGAFRIFISSHKDGKFYGAVLHYTKTGAWKDGEAVHLQMQLEQFIDNTEEGVYDQCIDWVNNNLPGHYTIEDTGTRTF